MLEHVGIISSSTYSCFLEAFQDVLVPIYDRIGRWKRLNSVLTSGFYIQLIEWCTFRERDREIERDRDTNLHCGTIVVFFIHIY